MKQHIKLFLVPALLLVSGLTGCSNQPTTYGYSLDLSEARFSKQIKDQENDFTGIKVIKTTYKGDKEVAQDIVEDFEIVKDEESNNIVYFEGEDFRLEYEFEYRDPIKVACIGDSLTAGHTWASEAYPVYLGQDLGNKFTIGNFGENGDSVTGYGGDKNNPNQRYIKRDVYKNSLKFNPDVIVMCLGTNDGTDWDNASKTFVSEYHTLINSYLDKFPESQWVFLVSPPCFEPNAYDIKNDVMKENVNPVQRALAEEYNFPLVDLRNDFEAMSDGGKSMLRPTWNGQPDLVHFSVKGAKYVAEKVDEIIDTFCF